MNSLFVPFTGNKPAAIEINGHRLIFVSTESDMLLNNLEVLGGNELREIESESNVDDSNGALETLAADIKGGVVLMPPGLSPQVIIANLEIELPWLQ